MKRPKNLALVLMALCLGGGLVVLALALGLDGTTPRGIPVWLLLAVGVASSAGMAVEAWRKPRGNLGDDSPVMTKGGKAVLGGYLAWFLVPLVAVVTGLVVGALR